MKLQTKVMMILGFVWVMLSLVIIFDSQYVLEHRYKKLEHDLIVSDIQGVQKAFNHMIASLILYNTAWSQWDESYEFMKKKNEGYIKANFIPGTFTSSRINFFLLYDANNMYYYGKYYDLNNDKFLPVPKSLLDTLFKNWSFLSHASVDSRKSGILNTTEGLVVMTSLPIITGEGNGPIKGSLLMGYYLTESQFKILSTTVEKKVIFHPLPLKVNNTILKSAYQHLQNEEYYIKYIDESNALGFIFLKDINEKPVGILQMDISRDVYKQGLNTVRHYLFLMITVGLIILACMWLLLRVFVLDRIIQVSNQVVAINKSQKFDQHIKTSGKDEFENMVSGINKMMMLILLSQNKLRYMAHHDHLTGLPNRTLFYDLLTLEISKAIRDGKKIAILFLDMDKFKLINDTYGHEVGDTVIKEVANRLKKFVTEQGAVSRSSGDEFVMYLRNVDSREILVLKIRQLLLSLSQTIIAQKHVIDPTFSVGISIFPDDGQTIEGLLRAADHAMYAAKKEPGNSHHFYSSEDEMV